jgi:hypothetical protein
MLRLPSILPNDHLRSCSRRRSLAGVDGFQGKTINNEKNWVPAAKKHLKISAALSKTYSQDQCGALQDIPLFRKGLE